MDLKKLHRALGGDFVANEQRAPGPGRSPSDRSLTIRHTRRGSRIHARAANRRYLELYFRQMWNWPAWEPGDHDPERQIPAHRLAQSDARVFELEAKRRRLADKSRTQAKPTGEVQPKGRPP
jgi:hypothetical protein